MPWPVALKARRKHPEELEGAQRGRQGPWGHKGTPGLILNTAAADVDCSQQVPAQCQGPPHRHPDPLPQPGHHWLFLLRLRAMAEGCWLVTPTRVQLTPAPPATA